MKFNIILKSHSKARDRLGAVFGVSILEDKGHARNELWDIVYQMSSESSTE
jgi:hypothetical protein